MPLPPKIGAASNLPETCAVSTSRFKLISMDISVFAVEDHGVTAMGLTEVFAEAPDISYLGHTHTVSGVLAHNKVADVVLLDLRLGDRSDPFANATAILATGARVIVYSSLDSPYLIRRALSAGIHGIVEKARSCDELIDAVRTVAAGNTWASADWAAAIDSDGDFSQVHLSAQQRAVLELYASGEPAKRVARILDISTDTVQDYLSRIRLKYAQAGRSASTKTDLMTRALEDGYLPLPGDTRGRL